MLKKIALFPIYFGAVFTGAKNFRDNYIIGSRFLNKMGLHVFRILLARMIWKLRQAQLFFLVTKEDRKFYNHNGYLLKNDFLAAETFEQIVKEVKNYNGQARQCVQGKTITWRVFLDADILSPMPGLSNLVKYKPLKSLLKYTSAKNAMPFFYIQQVRNGGGEIDNDPQKNLHSDTFHPTMKAWLFLEDVTPDKGPFTYVPGSNRITLSKLKWEYKKSTAATRGDKYSEKGSFRVEENELPGLGLPAPKSFAVAKNTLVIANTSGFHARGKVSGENVNRLEIWAYSRPNPFNPFVGFDSGMAKTLSHKIYKSYLAHKDRKAAKTGRTAMWHKADGAVV